MIKYIFICQVKSFIDIREGNKTTLLYVLDIFNKQNNVKETVVQALTTISKEKNVNY